MHPPLIYRRHTVRRALQVCAMLALSLFLIASTTSHGRSDGLLSRSGGPSEAKMLARGNGGIDGLAFFRPVLSGVLYRAGFHGGDKSRTGLSSTQRGALCDAGFSEARYADFGKNATYGETSCSGGGLNYQSARSGNAAEVMAAAHRVIKEPSRGPVLVHCMWGVHSSGAIAAMALVQFCGWSEERAKAYWDKARNGARCSGGCDHWIDAKLASFKVDPAMTISDAERAAICPD